MSAAHVLVVFVAAAVVVCGLVRCALVVYTVVIALNTGNAKRRQIALRVLRMLSPALSVKLGPIAITRGQAPGTPEGCERSK